jgi:hypothetical protein
MSEGHSLWLEVIPSSEADRKDGFDRRFDGDGNPPDWEGVAVLCRRPDDGALLMVLQAEPDETPTWALPGGTLSPDDPDGTIHEAVWMAGERLCDLQFSHADQRHVLLRYMEAPC